jgi:4-amino-4-deoxy-L-arabinose transferase-like glycosyltransferase
MDTSGERHSHHTATDGIVGTMSNSTLTPIAPESAAQHGMPGTDTAADHRPQGDLTSTPARASLGHRLWRGSESDPGWARPALLGLLVATAGFYLWNLTASGWANSFYSAAAQAGSASWKAFFFGSSDAANAITVDKPPAALWLMALSVRVFGLSSFAILLPEVLMGVASVGVLYATVKRQFGAAAGLIAGAVLALTPIAVLMFRFNNPDALLTLCMTLAAWATVRSIEKSSPKWFMIVGVFIGLGFLTKTLQVFLVVPGFALAYLVAANVPLLRRIWHTILGGLAIVVSAGWWVAIVELIPASARPYIGGSQNNSFLELTFGYNGLGRIDGSETGSVGGGANAGGNWGATGLTRMFNADNGGQISWLMPAALSLLIVGLAYRGRRPRTDARRAAYLLWGSWFLVTALTFSLMAGIYHAYYTIALAPAVAALVAMGAKEAWEHKDSAFAAIGLAAAMTATSVWGFVLLSRSTTWNSWLRVLVLAIGMAAAFGFLLAGRLHRRALPVLVGTALFATLLGPAAYSLQTVSVGHSGSIVTAGPTVSSGLGGGPGGTFAQGGMPGGPATGNGTTQGRTFPGNGTQTRGPGGGMGGLLDASTPSSAVVAGLSANADQYTWVAAAIGSQNAAGLQLGTQLPVMSIGGFNGSDPSPTLAQFKQYVADGKIHYFLAGGGMGGPSMGGSQSAAQISSWVTASFKAVTIGSQTFYDLTQPASSSTTSATATGA